MIFPAPPKPFIAFFLTSACVACGPTSSAKDDHRTGGSKGGPPSLNSGQPGPLPVPESCAQGVVTYSVGGDMFRTTLGQPSVTENLSDSLDALSTGSDGWINISPDGDWLVMSTQRFDSECNGWNCLAIVNSGLTSGEAIKVDGDVIHIEDFAAVASGGKTVIYPHKDGPHGKDLYAITKSNGSWGTPVLLTANSPYTYNVQPSVSADGRNVIFDCGPTLYNQSPTHICEVGADGTGFQVVRTTDQKPDGVTRSDDLALHSPDYFSDGSIVFESSWTGEQLWRLSSDNKPKHIASEYGNDNTPCVLANNCIVSLWLDRPGTSGDHEIKITDANGGNLGMISTGVDVADVGLGCGK